MYGGCFDVVAADNNTAVEDTRSRLKKVTNKVEFVTISCIVFCL